MRKMLLSPLAVLALHSAAYAGPPAAQPDGGKSVPALGDQMVDPRTNKPLDTASPAPAPASPAPATASSAPSQSAASSGQPSPAPAPATVAVPPPPPAQANLPVPGALPAAPGSIIAQTNPNAVVPAQPPQVVQPAPQPQGNTVTVTPGSIVIQQGGGPSLPLPGAPGQQPGMPNQAAAPPTPEQMAFDLALKQLLPMTPDQIRTYKQNKDLTDRTIVTPVNGPPRPVTRSISLSLKPGEPQPRLRLYPGNATTLTFSDVTGAPWPVMSVTVGNPQAFMAQEAGEKGKTNMVVISPTTSHAMANNLVVTLVNHPVPIILNLETGTSEVDYRLDVGMQLRGPNAAYDIVGATALPPASDAQVQGFLDGVAPKGARKLKTSDRDVEAWKMNDLVYVRTPLELLSPAYLGRASNVSGFRVYTLIESPVVIVSQDGRMASVKIGQ